MVAGCGGCGGRDWEGDGCLRLGLARFTSWGVMGVFVSQRGAWVVPRFMGLKGLGISIWSHH